MNVIIIMSLPGCLPELTLVSARELGQVEPEGCGNLIFEDCVACSSIVSEIAEPVPSEARNLVPLNDR